MTPYQSSFTTKVLNKKTLYAIQARHYKKLMGIIKLDEKKRFYTITNSDNPDQNPTEVIRIETKPIIDIFDGLEALDYPVVIEQIKNVCAVYQMKKDIVHMISPTQLLGISLTVFANSLYQLILP